MRKPWDTPDLQDFGWNGDGTLPWVDEIYTDNILHMFLEKNFEETEK